MRQGRTSELPPPPVRGIGTSGGYKMMIQDRSGAGYRALEGATFAMRDCLELIREMGTDVSQIRLSGGPGFHLGQGVVPAVHLPNRLTEQAGQNGQVFCPVAP